MSENLKTWTTNSLKKYLHKSKAKRNQQKTTKTDKTREQLQALEENANEVLFSIKGIWPFDLFPDEVSLDRQTLTITRNIFWGVQQKVICHYEDLVNSHVNLGPLFGSLNIYSKYFTDGEEQVNWFSKKDAEKMHAILQGLLITRKEGLDLKELSKEEIVEKLYSIGAR